MKFILLGAFALRDNVRPKVKSAVGYARDDGKMSIRLVSGDHIETATAVAKKAGIIKGNENEEKPFTVMHADEFEAKVGKNENEQI